MLRSWTDELRIVLRQHHVELGVFRLGRPLRSHSMEWQNNEEDFVRLGAQLLSLHPPVRWRIRIGGWHALHGVIPWLGPAANDEAWLHAARQDLQSRLRREADRYLMCISPQGYGKPCPYWSTDRSLVETWQLFATSRGARVMAVESLLLTQVSALRKELLPSTQLFLKEDGLVHVCDILESQWQHILTRAIEPGATLASSDIVRQEQLLRLQQDIPVQTFDPLHTDALPNTMNPVGRKLLKVVAPSNGALSAYLGL